MKIQLFVTGQPEQSFESVDELLKHEVQFTSGWWFKTTTKYKLNSFLEEISEALEKEPECLKINFSSTSVNINAFKGKRNVYSKTINL